MRPAGELPPLARAAERLRRKGGRPSKSELEVPRAQESPEST
jgi:hypothetical protein